MQDNAFKSIFEQHVSWIANFTSLPKQSHESPTLNGPHLQDLHIYL